LAGPATPVALALNGSLVSLGQGLGAMWGVLSLLVVAASGLGGSGMLLIPAFAPNTSRISIGVMNNNHSRMGLVAIPTKRNSIAVSIAWKAAKCRNGF
jgi:hypothetical protein